MDDPHARELIELIREERLACPSCGYELGELGECRCPECGKALAIQDWPEYGLLEETATLVRLRGPLPCLGCGALIGRGAEGRCPHCRRRVRLSDLDDRRRPPLRFAADFPPALRAALYGFGAFMLCWIGLGIWVTADAGRARMVRAEPVWLRGLTFVALTLSLLLVVLVVLPIDRSKGTEQLLQAPRWYHRLLAWLSWTTVGTMILCAVAEIARR